MSKIQIFLCLRNIYILVSNCNKQIQEKQSVNYKFEKKISIAKGSKEWFQQTHQGAARQIFEETLVEIQQSYIQKCHAFQILISNYYSHLECIIKCLTLITKFNSQLNFAYIYKTLNFIFVNNFTSYKRYIYIYFITRYQSESDMLLTKQTNVKTKKNYLKILNLTPAYNNTFAFFGMIGLRQDALVHVDQTGNQLGKFVFTQPVDTFCMLNDREFVVAQTRLSRLSIWNVVTHKFRYIHHYFINEQSDQLDLYGFGDSRYLCVCQFGRYNDNRIKLTYYNFDDLYFDPNTDKECQDIKQNKKDVEEQEWSIKKVAPFKLWQGNQGQWTYDMIIRKGNNSSLIGWMKVRNSKAFNFRTYSQNKQTQEWKYSQFLITIVPQQITFIPANTTLQIVVNNFWEFTKDVFIMICTSNREKQAREQTGIEDLVVNNHFLVDTKTQTIVQTKFNFGLYQDYLIDQMPIGSYHSMFRTFAFKDGNVLVTPIYYINNQRQEIVAQETWRCTYLNKYEYCNDRTGFIQAMYENGDVKQFVCMQKKIVEAKEISVHLMTCMYPDIDQDLLQDVVQLIDYGK